jgi:hypothetical protein
MRIRNPEPEALGRQHEDVGGGAVVGGAGHGGRDPGLAHPARLQAGRPRLGEGGEGGVARGPREGGEASHHLVPGMPINKILKSANNVL